MHLFYQGMCWIKIFEVCMKLWESVAASPKSYLQQLWSAEDISSTLHQVTQLMSTFHLCQVESSRMLAEIKELHDKIRQSAEEAKKKEALYKQLVRGDFWKILSQTLATCT